MTELQSLPPVLRPTDADLVPIGELRKSLVLGGRYLDRATFQRWLTRGVDGTRLPGLRIGGRWYSTPAALQWFVDVTSNPRAETQRGPTPVTGRPATSVEAVRRELESYGFDASGITQATCR